MNILYNTHARAEPVQLQLLALYLGNSGFNMEYLRFKSSESLSWAVTNRFWGHIPSRVLYKPSYDVRCTVYDVQCTCIKIQHNLI